MRSLLSNKKPLLSLVFVLFLCSGCAAAGTKREAMLANVATATGGNVETVAAALGSVSRPISISVEATFPDYTTLQSDFQNASVAAVYVKNNDLVKEGDVLVEFKIDYSEADLNAMRVNFAIAEREYDAALAAQNAAVAAAEAALAAAEGGMATAVRRAELALEAARTTRDYQTAQRLKSLEVQREALAAFEARIADNKLLAPRDGIVSNMAYLTVGGSVAPGTDICGLCTPELFLLKGEIGIINSLRYNQAVEVTLSREETVYAGKVVSAPNVVGEGQTGAVLIAPEPALAAFADPRERPQRVTVTAERYALENALVVPTAAMHTEDGARYVYIYENGIVKKRYVATGLTGASVIQIISGLAEGQAVVVD